MEANRKSYLNNLIGQTIKKVDVGISSVISLKKKENDQSEQMTSVYTQLQFDEYRLDVYNKTKIIGIGADNRINELIGLKVIDANETNDNAELLFDNGYKFVIDLRDKAFGSDPEAMCMQGPNNLIVVWD